MQCPECGFILVKIDEKFHERVDRLLAEVSDKKKNELVTQNKDYVDTHSSMQSFRPSKWLNDQIINAYFKLITSHKNNRQEVFAFDSYFWKTYTERKHDISSFRHLKTKNYFEYDLLLCPINVNEGHWTLIAVHIADRVIEYKTGFAVTAKLHLLCTVANLH